jgi:hypothetical protein
MHGGIGFTWDHDMHLWFKRAQALRWSAISRGSIEDNLSGDWLNSPQDFYIPALIGSEAASVVCRRPDSFSVQVGQ